MAMCEIFQVLGALPPDQMEMFYSNPRFKGLKVNNHLISCLTQVIDILQYYDAESKLVDEN